MVETLMCNGHSEDRIWEYSLRKVEAVYSLVNKRTGQMILAHAIAARVAAAEEKPWKKYVESFEEP